MKKIGLIALLGFFAAGCSFPDLTNLIPAGASPIPSTVPSSTFTPTDTATITPTQPTPTFTGTPTLIFTGASPTPSATQPAAGTLPATGPGYSFLTPGAVGFTSVQISGNMIRWGSCEPSSVKITGYVTDPVKEHTVLLFIRLKDTKSDETTDWGYGADMNSNGKGIFTYTVAANSISHYRDFQIAWVQFQLVAFDRNLKAIGRTQPYLSSISLGPCP